MWAVLPVFFTADATGTKNKKYFHIFAKLSKKQFRYTIKRVVNYRYQPRIKTTPIKCKKSPENT